MSKIVALNQYELPADVRRDGDGFLAVSPGWEACYAQGDTPDEAIAELLEVAASLVELYQEEGVPIPLSLRKKLAPVKGLRFNLPLVIASA